MTHISEFDRRDSNGFGLKVAQGMVYATPVGTEFDFEAEAVEKDQDWQPPFYVGDFPPPQQAPLRCKWTATTTFPIDPESDSQALLMGKPTRAELEQQIEDMKREVEYWKRMVDDVAEDYERELEKAERGREIDTEAVADAIADILAGYYRAL